MSTYRTSAAGASPARDEVAAGPGGTRHSGALAEVLLLRRAPVVRRPAVGEHRRDARAAGVPRARAAGERGPGPGPPDTVGARRVRGAHAVLGAGLVERMAADPRLPGRVVGFSNHRVLDSDHRVLHTNHRVAREHHAVGRAGQRLGRGRLEQRDPPVAAARRRAADVQPPAPARHADQGRALERRGAEPVLADPRHRREPLAVVRPRDDHLAAALRRTPDAVGDDERPVAVEHGARRARPLAGAAARRGRGDRDTAGPRQRHGPPRHRRGAAAGATASALAVPLRPAPPPRRRRRAPPRAPRAPPTGRGTPTHGAAWHICSQSGAVIAYLRANPQPRGTTRQARDGGG